MTFRWLLATEIRKLVQSHVFWVAPVVLTVYLALMLFGYEVYAARNGVSPDNVVSLRGQMTGSIVVSAYSTVRRMAMNMLGLSEVSVSRSTKELAELASKGEVPIEDRKLATGVVGDFDFWGTFFLNLLSPKPLPTPDCGCLCPPDAPQAPSDIAKPATNQPSAGMGAFFVGTAFAEGTAALTIPPPPESGPADSFVERLQSRLRWLTDGMPLDTMLIDRSRFNGMRFTYLSLYFSFAFIFPIIAVTVAAQMFAGEIAGGGMRTSLLRPVRRGHLLAAKLIVLAGYLLTLILLFDIVTMMVGVIFSGHGNLVIDSELLGTKGVSRLILGDGAIILFLLSTPIAVFSLLPLAFFAVLLSYLKPEASYVIGVSSVVYLILFTLGGLPIFDGIRFLFFTTYMDAWTLLFDSPMSAGGIAFKLTMIWLMEFGLLAIIVNIFSKRDIFE